MIIVCMDLKGQYQRGKNKLLGETGICDENKALFNEFFEYEEYKLKRRNSLPELDDGCYKTLLTYVQRFRNMNIWFKQWKN